MEEIVDFTKCRLNSRINGRPICRCPVCGRKGQKMMCVGMRISYLHKVKSFMGIFLISDKCNVLLFGGNVNDDQTAPKGNEKVPASSETAGEDEQSFVALP